MHEQANVSALAQPHLAPDKGKFGGMPPNPL